MSLFEILMLICFGSAWPASIYKSYTSKSNSGKSLVFMVIIFTGYVSGVFHKIFYHYDNVIWLYVFNALLVAVDMGLYFKNSLSKN
ncbi:MAG: hypothetical protein RBR08_13650 [Desulforegulaceae bacterium]|jgi:hypothetical protein|nr:hypothetical protein [Desulforegulaceae bacterium]